MADLPGSSPVVFSGRSRWAVASLRSHWRRVSIRSFHVGMRAVQHGQEVAVARTGDA